MLCQQTPLALMKRRASLMSKHAVSVTAHYKEHNVKQDISHKVLIVHFKNHYKSGIDRSFHHFDLS